SPEVSRRIGIQLPGEGDWYTVGLAVTQRPFTLDFAKGTLGILHADTREPDLSCAILNDRHDRPSSVRVMSQVAFMTMLEVGWGADPEAPVARRSERYDSVRENLFAAGRRERYETHTIEANEPSTRAHPEISIGGLRHVCRGAGKHPVLQRPRR